MRKPDGEVRLWRRLCLRSHTPGSIAPESDRDTRLQAMVNDKFMHMHWLD